MKKLNKEVIEMELTLKEAMEIATGEITDIDQLAGAYAKIIETKKKFEGYEEALKKALSSRAAYDAAYGESALTVINGDMTVKISPVTKREFDFDRSLLDIATLPSGIVQTKVILDHKLLRKAYESGSTDGDIDKACWINETPTLSIRVTSNSGAKVIEEV